MLLSLSLSLSVWLVMEMVSKQKKCHGDGKQCNRREREGKRMNNDLAFPHAAQGVPSIVCISQ